MKLTFVYWLSYGKLIVDFCYIQTYAVYMYLWKVNEPSVGMTSTIWHLLQLKRPWLVTIFESVNPKLWWWECETVTVPKFLIAFMDRFYVIQIQLICSTLWKCGGSNSFPVNSRQLFLTVPRQQTIFKLIGIPQGKLRRHRKTSTSAPTNRVLCPTFNHRRVVDFGLKSYMHVHRRWYVYQAKRHYHNEMWLDMDIFISTGKCVVWEKITFLPWCLFWLFLWELYCTDSYLQSSWKLYPC